jgi:hypothetical protein
MDYKVIDEVNIITLMVMIESGFTKVRYSLVMA